MEQHVVTLKIPDPMLKAAARLARDRDITVGQLVRELIACEIGPRKRAKTPNRADERLLASLQTLLAPDMGAAMSWTDLHRRLARHGYEVRPAGGGLTVHDASTGARLCKASELGFAYRRLVERFGAALPGHPHGDLGLGLVTPVPDIDVIEEF